MKSLATKLHNVNKNDYCIIKYKIILRSANIDRPEVILGSS